MATTPNRVSSIHLTLSSSRGLRLAFFALVPSLFLCRPAFLYSSSASGRSAEHEKPYALIFGTVWGPDNRPVYGVRIRIRRSDSSKPKWELYSDHRGEFAQRVPAGQADYLVWADLKDFKSSDYKRLHAGKEVKVHIQNDERADIGVHLTE
jgi:hypothetical protein